MVKKPSPDRPKGKAGRKPGPPEHVRSERLVVRMHPDLFGVLTERAATYGMDRSTYVERILITYVNAQENQRTIDFTGRFAVDEATIKVMKTNPADAWAAFGRRNQAVIGRHNAEYAATRAGKLDELDKE